MAEDKTKRNGYSLKADFISLVIIILFFVGMLVGLYYYDRQNDVLSAFAERMINLF
jgi:hypothetical protein